MNVDSWLTAGRVRIHGLLLAVCLWTVYAVDMSTPGLLDRNGLVKGTDFLHFYTLGNLALRGRGDLLYNMRAQAELARELVAQAPDSLYVPLYGPQLSLLFAPFARLPYGWALTAWLSVNVLIYAFCCHAVWKSCPSLQAYRSTVLILAIAFPGFFHSLAWGQTSGLALLCFTLAYTRPAAGPGATRRIGHWVAHLQASAGAGGGSRLCVRARVEGGGGRGGGCVHPTGGGLDALRHGGYAFLLPRFDASDGSLAAARASALSDPLAAFLLVLLLPWPRVAFALVCHQRSGRYRSGSSVLASERRSCQSASPRYYSPRYWRHPT